MDKQKIVEEMVMLARDLTGVQGSKVFLVEAEKKLEEIKEVCADNAADYALLGRDGEEAVLAYRKIYTMLNRVQQEIPSILRMAF